MKLHEIVGVSNKDQVMESSFSIFKKEMVKKYGVSDPYWKMTNQELEQYSKLETESKVKVKTKKATPSSTLYTDSHFSFKGKEYSVFDSEGNRISNTKEGIEAFFTWFKPNQYNTERGLPKPLYHGTKTKFTKFDLTQDNRHTNGIWLTDSKSYAHWIGNIILNVYTNFKKPKFFNIFDEGVKLAKEIGENKPSTSIQAQEIIAGGIGWDTVVSDMVKEAKSEGYDVLILERFNDNFANLETTAYIVFDTNKLFIGETQ